MADDRYTLSYTGEQVDELLGKIDNLGAATQSTDGLMSSEDKAKVDGIEDGAQENVIESVTLNGVAQQVLNKAVNIVLDGATYMGIVYQDGGSSTPPTQKLFYLTGENGTYTNFNNIVVNDGEVAFLCWTGATWVKDSIVTKGLIEDFGHTFYEDQTLGAGASLKVGSWSNIKLSSAGGQTIAEYIASQIEVIKQFTYTVADSLPTASADTMYIIYLIPSENPQSQNSRDEFITVRSGSEGSYTYSWEQIGSTEMDLSDYAKKDGVYPELFAGMAQGIVDTRSAGTPQEFLRRKSGGDGVGYMTRIKGNSIVWNQQIQKFRFSGVQYDNTTLQTIEANGTIDQPTNFGVVGHKCIVRLYYKCSADFDGTISFRNIQANSGAVTLDNNTTLTEVIRAFTVALVDTINVTISNRTTGSVQVGYYTYTDLTQMNTPDMTAAQFDALFPELVYAPNPGAIKNNAATGMVTDGFNQWDEVWESGRYALDTGVKQASPSGSVDIRSANAVKVFPGTEYCITKPAGKAVRVLQYDANGAYISYKSPATAAAYDTFTTNANVYYIRFCVYDVATYANNICINLSGARNGQYEPHWSDTTALPITTATGKLNGAGESVVISPNGFAGVGTSYDEGIVEKGMWTKTAKRRMRVDMGTLTWAYNQNGFFYTEISTMAYVSAIISTKYVAGDTSSVDKTMSVHPGGILRVKDSAYSDAAAFKTAMSGVILEYPLATEQLYVLDTPVPVAYQVDKDGTETVTTPEGTAPTSAPFKADTNYSISVGNLVRALAALQNA